MNIKICQVFILLTTISVAISATADIHVVDDSGQRVSLKGPARNIVSLAPNITELLFAVGAGQWITGVAQYSDYPEKAQSIMRIGGYQSLDYEKIITLQPDLIVAWESSISAGSIEKLKKLGIPVFITEAYNLDDIPVLLRKLARLTDTQKQAHKAINQYNQHLASLRQQFSKKKKISVFIRSGNNH